MAYRKIAELLTGRTSVSNKDPYYYVCDDFGLNHSVNSAIIELAQKEKIDATSVIVNCDLHSLDIEILKKSKIKKGLHLNLTEGRPLSCPTEVHSLIDKRGFFYSLPIFMLKLQTGKLKKEHLYLEISAQILAFKSLFPEVDHIDGHQHIQYHPYISELLIKSAREHLKHGPRFRFGPISNNSSPIKLLILRVMSFLNKKYHASNFNDKNNELSFIKVLDYSFPFVKSTENKVPTEVMMHVASPHIEVDHLNQTSFNWQERVDQYQSRIEGN